MESVEFQETLLVERSPEALVLALQDMRIWRQALKPPNFMDPRHYGPPDGLGARLACVMDHVDGIRRSGVLEVTSAEEAGPVVLKGEFPPVYYTFHFDIETEKPGSSRLSMRIEAAPQDLNFYRFRTQRKLGSLSASIQKMGPALVEGLRKALVDLPREEKERRRVTTDGYVEGPPVDKLADGGPFKLEILERDIILYRDGDCFYAVADYGSADGDSRGDGRRDGLIIQDPKDGRPYSMKTGLATDGSDHSIPTYPARLDGGRVYVFIHLT